MGSLWLVTNRQGMGYGDIQLGFLLGAWLGPMRMAITLFIASSLSLLIWIITSLFKGFNKDRAMPMAPFLSISGVLTFIGSFYYPNFFQLLVFK
jgi:leader peptidase (prepilin peptidase)/N-methyltransferase